MGGAISVQVLNELANVARRKMRMSWQDTTAFLSLLGGLLTVHSVAVETHETGLAFKAALDASHHIIVSFDGMQTATSSFVRTAFVELLKDRSFSDLKAQMGIIDSTRRSIK